jgi:hypothetical protein
MLSLTQTMESPHPLVHHRLHYYSGRSLLLAVPVSVQVQGCVAGLLVLEQHQAGFSMLTLLNVDNARNTESRWPAVGFAG